MCVDVHGHHYSRKTRVGDIIYSGTACEHCIMHVMTVDCKGQSFGV